jgi:DNA polymerase III subunit gamma/tau
MWDLKFRPTTFSDVVGNDSICKVLKKRSSSKDISKKSLMFGGPKGGGKTTLARICAKAIICEDILDGNPCNVCSSCVSISNGSSLSVMEFDAASSGSVDKIRSIVDSLEYSNIDGNPTIIILDEAHRLGPAAQDALLMAMEERRLIAIFCTTEPNKIRPALRDRLDEFTVRYPVYHEIELHVKKSLSTLGLRVEDSLIYLVSEIGENCLRVIWNTLYFGYDGTKFDENLIKEFIGYNSLNILKSMLRDIQMKNSQTYKWFDDLVNTESAEWVRINTIKCITNTKRKALGLPHKSSYVVSVLNQDSSIYESMCKTLVGIDKVSGPELEMLMFADYASKPVLDSPVAVKDSSYIIKPPKKEEVTKPPRSDNATIEIEGVKFNSEERITKLHDKIEPGRGVPSLDNTNPFSIVQYDRDKIPMSEQEFTRAIIERFKTT